MTRVTTRTISAAMIFAALALTTAVMIAPRPSAAAPYWPWCSRYFNKSNAEACAFVSWEQCMQTVSGIGGFCYRNPLPPPPAAQRPSRSRHARD